MIVESNIIGKRVEVRIPNTGRLVIADVYRIFKNGKLEVRPVWALVDNGARLEPIVGHKLINVLASRAELTKTGSA